MRMQAGLALLGVVAAFGCSASDGKVVIPYDAGTDGGTAGADGGDFTVQVLDPDAPGTTSLAIASTGSKVGVAYVVELPNGSPDAGFYEVRYVEPGAQYQKVATLAMSFDYGVSLAFTAAGTPVVSYLGGNSNGGSFWLQSDLALATPSSSSWAVTLGATDGLGYFAGTVVGLYSSIAVAPSGQVYAAYRDVHRGQFPNQDYEHSCVDFAQGQLGGGFTQVGASDCTQTQGGLFGFGGNNSLALGPGGEPAIACNTMPGGANDVAANLYFTHRKSGTFTAMKHVDVGNIVADAQRGPSLAYNSVADQGYAAGYGIAIEDRTKQTLYYFSSPDGDDWSKARENVWGSGVGGWWPSLAYDSSGAPNIAFYFCSDHPGSQCPQPEDELKLATKIPSGDWVFRTVDSNGSYLPRLTYVGGKAAIAYKTMDAKHQTLKLALEK